ncbi:Uncharacterized protein PECH_003467 [Penicillium ucsense]|uniref:Uncharacterized protein n=1 Tax=Penicillium ucsense TaxID=2839758 RepID=A0A8J8VVW2_9EURO|nr:Uncharacterized protein PECM_002947 [Penicillium ucsense]KAF7737551.1 Uncharacterized protein PECH_003467 [Penicillium ucsense]
MILSRLYLILAMTTLVTSASGIPLSSTRGTVVVARDHVDRVKSSSTPDHNHDNTAVQDDPLRGSYFLSESISEDQRIADQLAAMREAGFLAPGHDDRLPPTTEASHPKTNNAEPQSAQPAQDWISALDQVAETQSVSQMALSILPPLRFFVIASTAIAILTIIRGCLRARR